ncbi:MAG: hypothetical protein COY81_04685 [Candidatus Pacebacteria bacterium CG_4_10_14_0_8_um_filter_43_12]|nr:MAG: hypothetical protein COU66_01985 [Candidatus Pacebacteria bacterium CG10_big_fil_rev_8_21_14_0_10_44_11]PIY79030.1 MAG: hypothetical protein COY81_04685 [Candidatus Pacebacteria bacterium CG_4_10_14_0_8_um_filter_43_12]
MKKQTARAKSRKLPQGKSWWRQWLVSRRFRIRRYQAALMIIFGTIAIFSYLTNPFVRFSIVKDPFTEIQLADGQFEISPQIGLLLRDGSFVRQLGFIKASWHILTGKVSGGQKAPAGTVEQIIANIHKLRFNPEEPFLISGDHFSVFYPRSLGIFYHSLMDPRIKLSEEDWKNRQLLYLKSTAYALEVFSQANRLATTVVPIGPKSVVLINVSAPPSDTLYSILYALAVMEDSSEIITRYPYGDLSLTEATNQLQTQEAAHKLVQLYHDDLLKQWQQFELEVYDPVSGLIKRNILLSGVKDMAKHQSGFYDNVIYWKTNQLAQQLGIISRDEQFLVDLKQRILTNFWYEQDGHFIEDLSEESMLNNLYSSDWIVAYQLGFLSPDNPLDRPYLVKSVQYIQRNAIDQPFGLQYHPDQRPYQLYWWVGFFAPDYGSSAIWSNLGQEYIKLLVHLYQATGDTSYLDRAEKQLEAYTFNIKRYRGYPEVYSSQGDFFRQSLYKSVRQTGWVVSFEQARAMYQWTKNNQ